MKSIRDIDVKGKRVIMRVDFNVPMSAEGTVTEDKRITAALPTIEYLMERGARIVLASHAGRPAGKGFEARFSMVPAARVLARIIGKDVRVVPAVTGPKAVAATMELNDGDVMMIENLRFDPREKKNDFDFARELAELGDIYVNNAFGAAHRSHASIDAITHFLPSYAGFLLQKEVETLTNVIESPERPLMAILGGAKVSDKIALVDRMIENVDALIIGGGMCFTFLKSQGVSVGTSLVEEDWVGRAGEMLDKAKAKGVKIFLPIDVVVADMLLADADTSVCSIDEIPDDRMGLDIGPATAELFAQEIAKAKTIIWNGPMGVFEMKPFENGTREVAEALAANTEATTVIGGGDSAHAVKKFGVEDKMTFISTGGGASMQLLEGTPLPGVVALDAEVFESRKNRRPLIAGNWKMNMTWASAVSLAQGISDKTMGLYAGIDIVLCPPFTCMKGVENVIEFDSSKMSVGAQNVHEGLPVGTAACTGEISVEMIKDLGSTYCIIGHSERRAANGETDALVNAKARLLLDNDVTPIICCGESEEVNEKGESTEFVTAQVRAALAGMTPDQVAKVVIAYEPIWAIGTGKVPTPESADMMAIAIRSVVAEMADLRAAGSVRVLYGGSMKPENAEQFLLMGNIDGGLIGGASLDAKKFVDIIKTCEKVKKN